MRPSISVLISVLAISGSISCSGVKRPYAQEPDKNHIGEVVKSEEGEFYLRLVYEDRQMFLNKLHTIKIGDSRESVEALLGKPWSDDRATTKERGKFIGRFVTYYLTKYRKNLVNQLRDELVMFKFGTDDRLKSISVQIHEVGKSQ